MSNQAAWLVAKQQYPLQVKDALYPEPGADEVLIKIHYAALNPGKCCELLRITTNGVMNKLKYAFLSGLEDD